MSFFNHKGRPHKVGGSLPKNDINQLLLILKGGSGSGNFNHSGIPGHQGGSTPGIGSTNLKVIEEMMSQSFGNEVSATIIPDDWEPTGWRISKQRIKVGSKQGGGDLSVGFSKESGLIHTHPPGSKYYPSTADMKILTKLSKGRGARGWQFAIVEVDKDGKPSSLKVWSANKAINVKVDRDLYSLVRSGDVKEETYKL